MIDGFQRQALSTRLQIPLLYGVDAVHGHNNVVGATIFPHNNGLGAARDADLVEQVQRTTAQEVRATGVPWAFSPCLCVTRDERWGRSYESFGEDPALVTAMADAAIVGLQGADQSDLSGPDKVLATAKHWVGDGGTTYDPALAGSGYPIDQGITHVDSLDELQAAARRPVRARDRGGRRLDHAVVLGGLDRGCGPGPDARERRPEHRPAQGRARLRRVPHQRLGGHRQAARRHVRRQGGPLGERRPRHGDGAVQLRRVHHGDHRRRSTTATSRRSGSTTPSAGSSTQKFALGLFDAPFADRSHGGRRRLRRAPRRGPRGGREVAGAAEERRRPAAAGGGHQGLRRRLQRRRPRQPGGRLDHLVAGRLGRHHARHVDPRGHPGGRRRR